MEFEVCQEVCRLVLVVVAIKEAVDFVVSYGIGTHLSPVLVLSRLLNNNRMMMIKK